MIHIFYREKTLKHLTLALGCHKFVGARKNASWATGTLIAGVVLDIASRHGGIVKHGQTECIHNATYDHLKYRCRDTVVYPVLNICNHAYYT